MNTSTTQTSGRSMIAKYSGRCMSCGGAIRRGSRITYYGRGLVECFDCLSSDDWAEPDAAVRAGINVYRFNTGAVVTRNRNGRCEDAPCCGCCS